MTRTLVTGAGGFVGQALVHALAAKADGEIVATDLAFASPPASAGVRWHEERLDDPAAIARLFASPFDRIVHLATVAGVGSAQFDLGRATNLVAMQMLLEAARRPEAPPRFVYASSVGVFGPPLPDAVDDATLPVPTTSYGTHKLIGELLVSDYSRAGLIDGIALRLPGIVARPAGSDTMLSAFLSDMFHAARRGEPLTIPLAGEDRTWVMSRTRLIDNLLHALDLPAERLPQRRYWTLPALAVRIDALIAALERVYGRERVAGLTCIPDAAVRRSFAQVPLVAAGATALGFRGDTDADALVQAVIAASPDLSPQGAL
ncbi:hypothetical protein GCM10011380_35540 [Sphingomonas metalli]|uniref:NAD-dependent epimerase/dehydratase domain-containing protein n=1 Tax=Sphingomonas metalli TaxID=1779358 RepID=A0A916WYU0_9SPHN|nr:NAD-dependent epimerase/dehydratase family protein [Sphingomonas metalli]GGB42942.1 hypothetical protein GCM10011380_35540 [Sphingomonas metalli]